MQKRWSLWPSRCEVSDLIMAEWQEGIKTERLLGTAITGLGHGEKAHGFLPRAEPSAPVVRACVCLCVSSSDLINSFGINQHEILGEKQS